MQEIENVNAELVVLADMLARIKNQELANATEDELPLRQTIWQINEDRVKMKARFDHLNSVLRWWSEQTNFIFDHVTGPVESGFRAPSAGVDGMTQDRATAQHWYSARTLLRRLNHHPLDRALKIWTDDLIERGMLSGEDAARVTFTLPRDEFREQEQIERTTRLREFQTGFEKVLGKVAAVAEKRGQHFGYSNRQALGVWNRRFAEKYRDGRLLTEFVKALANERLLPKSYERWWSAEDLVKGILGV